MSWSVTESPFQPFLFSLFYYAKIHPFHILNIFTYTVQLDFHCCATITNIHHYNSFHLVKLNIWVWNNNSPFFPIPTLETTIILSVFIIFTTLSGTIQYFSFSHWFLSLGLMSSRFIHNVAYWRISFLLDIEYYPIVLYTTLCSSIHWSLDDYVASKFWVL